MPKGRFSRVLYGNRDRIEILKASTPSWERSSDKTYATSS